MRTTKNEMPHFIHCHALRYQPPGLPNRDDLGNPKTAMVGNTRRGRISSQSQNYWIRNNEEFQRDLEASVMGVRTKGIGLLVAKHLLGEGYTSEISYLVGTYIARAVNGKGLTKQDVKAIQKEVKENGEPGNKTLTSDSSFFYHASEISRIKEMATQIAAELASGEKNPTDLSKRKHEEDANAIYEDAPPSPDVALLGRMNASYKEANMDGAVQIGHAFTLTPMVQDVDFWSVTDDLSSMGVREDAGSDHLGRRRIYSGVMGSFCSVDVRQLRRNMGEDATPEQVMKVATAYIKAFLTTAPGALAQRHGVDNAAFYAVIEKTNLPPQTYTVPFLKPLESSDVVTEAVQKLEEYRASYVARVARETTQYEHLAFSTLEGPYASLTEVATFLVEGEER